MTSRLHVKGYFSDKIVAVSELLVGVNLASFKVGGSVDFVPAVVVTEHFSAQFEIYTSLLTLQQGYYKCMLYGYTVREFQVIRLEGCQVGDTSSALSGNTNGCKSSTSSSLNSASSLKNLLDLRLDT